MTMPRRMIYIVRARHPGSCPDESVLAHERKPQAADEAVWAASVCSFGCASALSMTGSAMVNSSVTSGFNAGQAEARAGATAATATSPNTTILSPGRCRI
jgi:hypothetical protein